MLHSFDKEPPSRKYSLNVPLFLVEILSRNHRDDLLARGSSSQQLPTQQLLFAKSNAWSGSLLNNTPWLIFT